MILETVRMDGEHMIPLGYMLKEVAVSPLPANWTSAPGSRHSFGERVPIRIFR